MKRSSSRSEEAIDFAKSQRRTSNEFADLAWQWLRNRQICQQKFRREVPIPPYTVDFCCSDLKLVIEIDGEAHLTAEGKKHDRNRDAFLADLGFKVLRILGYDVIRDGHDVVTRMETFVRIAIDAKTPHPQPLSPRKGEGSQNCIASGRRSLKASLSSTHPDSDSPSPLVYGLTSPFQSSTHPTSDSPSPLLGERGLGGEGLSAQSSLSKVDSTKSIGVSAYQIRKHLPDQLKSPLPTIEQIEAELSDREAL